jgi:tetratricopeptide (TPR) repeat protein
MTQLSPSQAFNEAQRLLRMGDYPRAGSLTQQLVQNLPDEPPIRGLHGAALARNGRLGPGLAMMLDALDKAGEDRVKCFLAIECCWTMRQLNRAGEALELAERAIGFDASNTEACGAKAGALVDLGRLDDAKAFVESCEGDGPGLSLAWGRACLLGGDAEAGVERVAAASKQVGVSAVDLEDLLRVLGALCERTGRDDDAFDAWRRAARLRPAEFDADANTKTVNELINQWTPEALAKIAPPKGGSGRSVFLVGAPGAGHELVEAIIASHPDGFGCGPVNVLAGVCRSNLGAEPTSFRRVIKQPGKLKGRQLMDAGKAYAEQIAKACPGEQKRLVDAQAHNFYHAGAIPLMNPRAKIVVCTREPIEAALASFASVPNQPWAHDLQDLGQYSADASRLCVHWMELFEATGAKFHQVKYEDLVAEPETTVRALIEFLGLEFDAACLSPEKNAALRTLPGDELRLPMSEQVHTRADKFAGRTKSLRTGLGDS